MEAERIFAYDEAMAAYGRALECAESLGLEEQLATRGSFGERRPRLRWFTGDVAFRPRAGPGSSIRANARDSVSGASSLVTNGDQRGLDYVHEALLVFDPETDPLETANALAIEGRFHHLAGQHHEAIALLERAVALASPAVEKEITPFGVASLSTMFGFLAGAHQHLGRFADGNVWAWRAVEFGKQHEVLLAQALGCEFLGENTINAGDWQKALEFAFCERDIVTRLHSRERQA